MWHWGWSRRDRWDLGHHWNQRCVCSMPCPTEVWSKNSDLTRRLRLFGSQIAIKRPIVKKVVACRVSAHMVVSKFDHLFFCCAMKKIHDSQEKNTFWTMAIFSWRLVTPITSFFCAGMSAFCIRAVGQPSVFISLRRERNKPMSQRSFPSVDPPALWHFRSGTLVGHVLVRLLTQPLPLIVFVFMLCSS